MDSSDFDRLARYVAKGVSRRGLLAAAAGLAMARSQRAFAAQLTPSTCGASGEVCTMLLGCCDGLTCVTSAINTNYGVCVAGEGGTISIGTSLISPFSENVEQEVAAMAAATTDTTSSTTTTDVVAEREQRIADKKLRKENRRDDKKLRKNNQQDEQQDRREDRRLDRDSRRGPKLELRLFNPGQPEGDEAVRVTNRDDVNVVLTRIEPVLAPSDGVPLTTAEFTLSPGKSYLLISGITTPVTEDEFGWIQQPVCGAEVGDGFLIRAAFSSTVENFDYVILCDGSANGGGGKPNKKRRRRRQRDSNGSNSKNKNG